MNNTAADIIILGAGLTGLTLAHSLQEQGRSVLVLEARERLGGRIHTLTSDNGPPVEMGATWYFPHFRALYRLMTRLGVGLTEQFTKGYSMYDKRRVHSHGDSGMFRIKGGSRQLIDSLYKGINPNSVLLNSPVSKAEKTSGGVVVTTEGGQQYTGHVLVTTLPPQLLHHSVQFSPELPSKVQKVMANTHTWMGDAIKAAVSYPRAWWRDSDPILVTILHVMLATIHYVGHNPICSSQPPMLVTNPHVSYNLTIIVTIHHISHNLSC